MKNGKVCLILCAAVFGTAFWAPTLQGRTCSGNGDVIGSYGFIASRSGLFALGAVPPGSNSTTGTGSLIPIVVTPPGATTAGSRTPVGSLVAGLINPNAFSVIGRLFADGAGNLYGAPLVGSLTTNTLIGTYNVSSDCSVTMSISDPFLNPSTATGSFGVTTGGPSVTLEGEIVGGGNSNEIDLIVTGPSAAGAVVTLIRTSQFNSCSNASLSGNFGIQGQGFVQSGAVQGGTGAGGTAVTPATGNPAFVSGGAGALGTPFALLGRFVADGAGNFTSDFAGTQSPLARGITGSYTVNADCSGTARLTDASGITRNISFILVNEEAQCSTSARLQSSARQKLRFVFTDSGVIGDGTARQQ